jgi:hypothetical protein
MRCTGHSGRYRKAHLVLLLLFCVLLLRVKGVLGEGLLEEDGLDNPL